LGTLAQINSVSQNLFHEGSVKEPEDVQKLRKFNVGFPVDEPGDPVNTVAQTHHSHRLLQPSKKKKIN